MSNEWMHALQMRLTRVLSRKEIVLLEMDLVGFAGVLDEIDLVHQTRTGSQFQLREIVLTII